MPMEPEKTIRSERIFQGRLLTLRVDTVAMPNGRTTTREIVEHDDVVFIVPVDAQGNVLMVRQYRKAVEQELLEIPAGVMEPDEEPIEAAQRELREETGFRARSLKHMASFYITPGFSTEYSHLYLATDLVHDPLEAEDDENIEVCPVSSDAVIGLINSGEIKDSKSIAGLLLYLTCYRNS